MRWRALGAALCLLSAAWWGLVAWSLAGMWGEDDPIAVEGFYGPAELPADDQWRTR